MKTPTISEAARDLARWLEEAVAGEDIGTRTNDKIVALRPLPPNGTTERLSPREALRLLQQQAHLTSARAESYVREVHAERLAAEKRSG